jgi:threonine/homoserine/homoserine lactone efflux protein
MVMDMFVWKGALLGFSVAAPVGPIGVLCITRTLRFGSKYGFLTGMGAATADCLYGLVAGLSLASISSALIQQQHWIRLVGGLFLLYLGWKVFSSRPSTSTKGADGGSLLAAYLSSFALTVTNPMTILSFTAAFAGLGLGSAPDSTLSEGLWLVAGVFSGSAFWWLILSLGTGIFRQKVSERHLHWINRASGFVILSFAAIALSHTIRSR